MKDGWHVICGYKVYVENDRISGGILGEGNRQRGAGVYRWCRRGGWDLEYSVTVNAFRAAVNRGTMKLA